MRPKIIPRTVVVADITEALRKFAEDMDAKLPANLEAVAADACHRRLTKVLEPHEATALWRLVAEPRMQCADCTAVVSIGRGSGGYCIACATRRRRASQTTPTA